MDDYLVDRSGNQIRVGDQVSIQCVIESINPDDGTITVKVAEYAPHPAVFTCMASVSEKSQP